MKRTLAIILSLILPGLGEIILERPVNGLFLFASYTFFVLLGVFRFFTIETTSILEDRMLCLAIGAASASWMCALVETCQLAFDRRGERTKAARDKHIRDGMIFHLKGEFGQAADEFRKALALDRQDVDARFHLAMALKAQGLHREAKQALKKCLALDAESKWYSEICDEMESLSS